MFVHYTHRWVNPSVSLDEETDEEELPPGSPHAADSWRGWHALERPQPVAPLSPPPTPAQEEVDMELCNSPAGGGSQGDDDGEAEEAFNQEEREEISNMAMELVVRWCVRSAPRPCSAHCLTTRERSRDAQIEEHVEEFSYPEQWTLQPGAVGFNQEAHTHMLAGGVLATPDPRASAIDTPSAALVAQLHQKTVSFLLHPRTPVDRMLVRPPLLP